MAATDLRQDDPESEESTRNGSDAWIILPGIVLFLVLVAVMAIVAARQGAL